MAGSRSWWPPTGEEAEAADLPGADVGRRAVALLAPATFFEGYDGLILGLALPLIVADFGLSVATAGVATSVIYAGSFGVLALLPLADRLGRRPVLAATIAGYTVATFATAFSRGVADFVAYQFVARVFLGGEYALAMIVLVELLPAERRGRTLGLVSSMSAFGMAGAGVGFLAVAQLGASWRVLYLVGVAPLLLLVRARRDLPETAPWRAGGAAASAAAAPAAVTVPDHSGEHAPALAAGVRPRWLLGAVLLAFLFSVFPTAVTTFASLLVLREWGWDLSAVTPGHVALWILAVGGFFAAGRLMDAWGRRPTAVLFLAGAAAAGLLAFRAAGTTARVVGLALVIFGLTGSTPCAAAFATEPFPARARGRVAALLRLAGIAGAGVAPALTGLLAGRLGGVGPALSAVGLSYAAAALVVVALLPETRSAPTPIGDPG